MRPRALHARELEHARQEGGDGRDCVDADFRVGLEQRRQRHGASLDPIRPRLNLTRAAVERRAARYASRRQRLETHAPLVGLVADQHDQPHPGRVRRFRRGVVQRLADAADAEHRLADQHPSSSAAVSPMKIGVVELAPTSSGPTLATKLKERSGGVVSRTL